MMPQAFAAMSLKMAMPAILTRFGYRAVLISNTLMLGVMILLFGTIGAATSLWWVVFMVFLFGFFSSLQYTSMNTLVYADVNERQASSASTISSTAQQMSISFGVAAASLVTALFIPDSPHTAPGVLMSGIHRGFLVLGAFTMVSATVFGSLRSNDGNAVSQHNKGLVTAG
jgi:MFS family permease